MGLDDPRNGFMSEICPEEKLSHENLLRFSTKIFILSNLSSYRVTSNKNNTLSDVSVK